jgi:hypothetical protein
MAKATKEAAKGRTLTALVVRYLDGRQSLIDGDSDDVCPIYEPDTVTAAAQWLFDERAFERCRRVDALAEVVLVTVLMPVDPAELQTTLHAATMSATVSFGYVRVAALYAEVS